MPFGVSPCCIGKLRRGPSSRWLRELLLTETSCEPDPLTAEAKADKSFALLASWADSEHVVSAAYAPSSRRRGGSAGDGNDGDAAAAAVAAAHLEAATRRDRCKTLVELDRLIALSERRAEGDGAITSRPGRLLRITGAAMATSGQTELLTGAVAGPYLG